MTTNQIIVIILCTVTLIVLGVVVYLKMFPDKWYLYRIVYRTNIWRIETKVWLWFKVPDELSRPQLRKLFMNRIGKDFQRIEKIKLIGLKRCKKGKTP